MGSNHEISGQAGFGKSRKAPLTSAHGRYVQYETTSYAQKIMKQTIALQLAVCLAYTKNFLNIYNVNKNKK